MSNLPDTTAPPVEVEMNTTNDLISNPSNKLNLDINFYHTPGSNGLSKPFETLNGQSSSSSYFNDQDKQQGNPLSSQSQYDSNAIPDSHNINTNRSWNENRPFDLPLPSIEQESKNSNIPYLMHPPQPNIPAPLPPPLSSTPSSTSFHMPYETSSDLLPHSRSPSPSKNKDGEFKVPRKQVEHHKINTEYDTTLTTPTPTYSEKSPIINKLGVQNDNSTIVSLEEKCLKLSPNKTKQHQNSQKSQPTLTNSTFASPQNAPFPVPHSSVKVPESSPPRILNGTPGFANLNSLDETSKNIKNNSTPFSIPELPIQNNSLYHALPTIPQTDNLLISQNRTDSESQLYPGKNTTAISNGSLSLGSQIQSLKGPPLPPKHTSSYSPRPNFPKSFVISQQEFHKYLENFSDQILVLDIRSREYFNEGRIPSEHNVCVDPIAMRNTIVTDAEFEDAVLAISPRHERKLFQDRDKYPLIVYYDANTRSTDFMNGNFRNNQEKRLFIFFDHIYRNAKTKTLKQPPCLLVGGLEDWTVMYGKDNIFKTPTAFVDKKEVFDSGLQDIQNNYGSNFQQPYSSIEKNNNTYNTTHWNNMYSDSDVVALQPPQTIPSRPYGSRKGSEASPNTNLSFDSSFSITPVINNEMSSSKSYVRSTNEYLTELNKARPQSLQQLPYPDFRTTGAVDFPSAYSPVSRNTQGTTRPEFQTSMPKQPDPVVYGPNSRSQYTHTEINSGSAMGHPPGEYLSQMSLTRPVGNGFQVNQQKTDWQKEVMKSFSTGLTNLGNTCYMNCIIQCLAATYKLSTEIIFGPSLVVYNSKLGYHGRLYNSFAGLLKEMVNKRNSYVSPRNFKELCGSLLETFKGYEQQDCHEFLNFILDGLHEEMNISGNKTPIKPLSEEEERQQEKLSLRKASRNQWNRHCYSNNSPITTLVQGQYLSRLTCTVCQTTSTTYNAFSCLSLPIPLGHRQVNLEHCFELFTMREVLDGDNAWLCPKCKTRRRTEKQMMICRLPNILIIHLKRFKQSGRYSDKLETLVSYPSEKLDLTKFWVRPSGPNDIQEQGSQHPPFLYNLYGVAIHQGTLKGGHYTSFVNRGSNGWCYFDDTKVYRNVHKSNVINNQNAYVLFYERVEQLY